MDDPETPARDPVLLIGTPNPDRQWTAICQTWRCAQCGAVVSDDDPGLLRERACAHARTHRRVTRKKRR